MILLHLFPITGLFSFLQFEKKLVFLFIHMHTINIFASIFKTQVPNQTHDLNHLSCHSRIMDQLIFNGPINLYCVFFIQRQKSRVKNFIWILCLEIKVLVSFTLKKVYFFSSLSYQSTIWDIKICGNPFFSDKYKSSIKDKKESSFTL